MSALRTEMLGVAVGARRLIHDLNWQVENGETWFVLGRNGVGKTCLIFTLAGLARQASGKVFIGQDEIVSIAPGALAMKRGLMLQHQSDAFGHTVMESVLVGRTPHRVGRGWDSEDDRNRASAALEAVGLPHLADKNVLELSGGERQRVALACLLAQAPDVFLLDEPTSHQDAAQQLAVMQLVRGLAKKHALIVNCHDINLAARFASHVLLLAPDRHWAGPAAGILKPELLEHAFGCGFRLMEDEQGAAFVAC